MERLERASGLGLRALGFGRQLFQAVHRLDSGVTLLQMEMEPGEPSRRFLVLDPRGRVAAEVDFPLPVDPDVRMASTGDLLTVVCLGSYDEQYVARFRMRRIR